MFVNTQNIIRVSVDAKVKSPAIIYAGLPDAVRLIVFLGVKRRMTEITEKIDELFAKKLLDMRWDRFIAILKTLSENGAHWFVAQERASRPLRW